MKTIYLLIFLLLPIVSFAEAQPPLPVIDTFYGSVSLRGIPAPAGTVIDIQLGSSHIGNTSVKADGTYKSYIGVGNIGDSVVFLVNGAVVGSATRAGTTQNLDLSLSPYKTITASLNSINKTIDFRNEYLDINIRTNRDVSNEPLSIEMYNDGAGSFSIGGDNYIKGIVIDINNSVVSNATITIRYSDGDISEIDESSIKLYYYTLSSWELVESHQDTSSNSITADIPHFSTYALFGTPNAVTPYTPSPDEGNNGGGESVGGNKNTISNATTACTPSWSCTEWSSCANGVRARTCTDKNNCGLATDEPAQSQDCSILESGKQVIARIIDGENPYTPTGLFGLVSAKDGGIIVAVWVGAALIFWQVKKKFFKK